MSVLEYKKKCLISISKSIFISKSIVSVQKSNNIDKQMGQNPSSSTPLKYIVPLPDVYQKADEPQIYKLKNIHNQANPIINRIPQSQQTQYTSNIKSNINELNPQVNKNKQPLQKQSIQIKNGDSGNKSISNQYPLYLRHYSIVLNKFETQAYLNHLAYRNQAQFKDYIVQVPFGDVEKHQKYTKINLFTEQINITLNQLYNIPFRDMCKILYTSLMAYQYLHSYFGLFKIQQNMIGFTRNGHVKVWLNHNLAKDKPLPIISDVNMKRFKQQQSYMVSDLLTIFMNKVDKITIPHNFNILDISTRIKSSRMTSSRLSFSRALSEKDLAMSMMSSLQTNLISDFSDGSFEKCLQYTQSYFNWKRPSFTKFEKNGLQNIDKHGSQNNALRQTYSNFIPCILDVIRSKNQKLMNSSTISNASKANTSINVKQLILKDSHHVFKSSYNNNFYPLNMNHHVQSQQMSSSLPKNKINFNYSNNQTHHNNQNEINRIFNSQILNTNGEHYLSTKVSFSQNNEFQGNVVQNDPNNITKNNLSFLKRPQQIQPIRSYKNGDLEENKDVHKITLNNSSSNVTFNANNVNNNPNKHSSANPLNLSRNQNQISYDLNNNRNLYRSNCDNDINFSFDSHRLNNSNILVTSQVTPILQFNSTQQRPHSRSIIDGVAI